MVHVIVYRKSNGLSVDEYSCIPPGFCKVCINEGGYIYLAERMEV